MDPLTMAAIGAGASALSGMLGGKRKDKHRANQQRQLDNYMKNLKKDPAKQRELYNEDAQAGMDLSKSMIDEAGGKEKVFEEYMGTQEAKDQMGRLKDTYGQSQDVVSRRKEELKGYDTKEMSAMRTTAAMQRQGAEAEAARQASGQMAASGMRGGRAAKAKAAASLQARRDAAQSERDMMILQKQEQTRALGAYQQSIGQAGLAAQAIGSEASSQFGQAIDQRQSHLGTLSAGATGMMNLGQQDRALQDQLMADAMQMKMQQGPKSAGALEQGLGAVGSFAKAFM